MEAQRHGEENLDKKTFHSRLGNSFCGLVGLSYEQFFW